MYVSPDDHRAAQEAYYHTRSRETMGVIGGICLLLFGALVLARLILYWLGWWI